MTGLTGVATLFTQAVKLYDILKEPLPTIVSALVRCRPGSILLYQSTLVLTSPTDHVSILPEIRPTITWNLWISPPRRTGCGITRINEGLIV